MIFPVSQPMLLALKGYYALYDDHGLAIWQCRLCKVVFRMRPESLTPGNYSGLMTHGELCRGPGRNQGPIPVRVQPFGVRHER